MLKQSSRTAACLYLVIAMGIFLSCRQEKNDPAPGTTAFGEPVAVTISGYTGHCMEPFLSPDGNTLFFNNLNAAPENTNLHRASRISDNHFRYEGELTGANSPDLDGVPLVDKTGQFYFISTRSYSTTLSTVYQGRYSAGQVSGVELVNGISLLQPGLLIFDAAISPGGDTLYLADGRFDNSGIPVEADLSAAVKTAGGFQRLPGSVALFDSINTPDLEYAPCIAANQLELYFTRLSLPVSPQREPQVMLSVRKSVLEPFGRPAAISSITGFAEAPALSPDQKTIYYHKRENGKFVLYTVSRR